MNEPASSAFAAQDFQAEMYTRFSPILEKFDLVICPTLALPSLPADQSPLALDVTINGKRLLADVQWALTYPFNMVGECPGMSVPSGFCTKTGVPTGIQIVGRSFDDLRVFRAAAAYEEASPWRGRWPAL